MVVVVAPARDVVEVVVEGSDPSAVVVGVLRADEVVEVVVVTADPPPAVAPREVWSLPELS